MGWHVVTRHHGPEPLFANRFCIRTHPFRPLSAQPLGSEKAAVHHIHHRVALDLDFLIVSIQFDSLLLRPTSERRPQQIMSNQGPQLRHKASEPATGKVSPQRGSASEPRSNAVFSILELIDPFFSPSHMLGRLDRRREGETSRPQSIRQRRGPLFPRPKLSDGRHHHPGERRLRDPMHLPVYPLSQLERQYERSAE